MKREIISKSEQQTYSIAQGLGQNSQKGTVYALYGDLGTGKTIFAKGIAQGLGIKEDVTSPTFTLMEIYTGNFTLYHFDLYRINFDYEFDELFFEEYWESDGVSIIEWADKAGERLPLNTIKITIDYIDQNCRRIIIEYPGN